jgi:hypothetical protein
MQPRPVCIAALADHAPLGDKAGLMQLLNMKGERERRSAELFGNNTSGQTTRPPLDESTADRKPGLMRECPKA